MRVLIATDVRSPSGVDRYVRAVATALRAAGHDPEVAVGTGTATDLPALEREGILVHRLRLSHIRHPPAAIAADCGALLDGRAPGWLHVVCGMPWSCLALRDLATARDMPLVVTEQYVPDDIGNKLSDGQAAAIARSYARARVVIFVSEGNRRRMAAATDLSGVRWEVIPNGVPVEAIALRSPSLEFRRRRALLRAGAGGLRVMTAARFTAQKGLDVLIDAVALLAAGTVERVDVFGDGPERGALERRRAGPGCVNIVRFPGWCDDVLGAMADYDLLVLPSRQEGMPFVLLESMAAGIPAIAADVPGALEALDGGRAGTLVPREDPRALARALEHFARAVPDAIARAAVARARVSAEYDLDALMARTLAVWHDRDDPSVDA